MNPLEKIVKASVNRKEVLDLHLHTEFSIDVFDGSTFEEYIIEGHEQGIIPGFLDHFQSEKLRQKKYPFNREHINSYFEAYDRARERGWPSYIGLEVDFYAKKEHEDWNLATMDWIDDHGEHFDYMVGTIHDVHDFTITIPFELENLLKKSNFEQVQEEYFLTLQEGICYGMFDGFAHLDVVYRFCGKNGILPGVQGYFNDQRTWEAMIECKNQGVVTEINIRGFDHPWNTTYPARPLLDKFKKEHPDNVFFVGSDSHNVSTFTRLAPTVKEYNKWVWD